METKKYRFDEVTINHDKKRKPLSAQQRAKMRGRYRYFGAQNVIDYVNNYLFDGEYLLIAEDGENLKSGKQNIAQIVEGQFWLNNHAHIVQTNELCNIRYLEYWLNATDISAYITGSAQPKLSQSNMNAMEIELPERIIQDKIVNILSSFDKKIEVNNQINRNLSEQVAVIYKSWFVDFEPFERKKPDDWFVGTVDDLANEVVCGKTPSTKKEEYYGDDVPFVTIPDMHGCVYTVHTERKLSVLGADSQSKKTLPKNSICVSCIGTAGLVILLPEPSQTNQQINSIVPKSNYSPYYIYLMMSTMSETINKLGQAGSTIVNLNKTQFGKIEVMIPSVSAMAAFDEIVEPMFKEILSNQIENIRLSNLRDTLLPRLISGELDVSDLDI